MMARWLLPKEFIEKLHGIKEKELFSIKKWGYWYLFLTKDYLSPKYQGGDEREKGFPDMKGFFLGNLKYIRAFAVAWLGKGIVQEVLDKLYGIMTLLCWINYRR